MKYDRMKKIQCQMEDELSSAISYMKDAMDTKYSDRAWADNYYTMAQQEFAHMNNLHAMALEEINKLAASGDKSYDTMKPVFDYLHARLMDKAAEYQSLVTLFKN